MSGKQGANLKATSGKVAGTRLPFLHTPVAWAWSHMPFNWEVLLLAIAVVTRFWRLGNPNSVVFDESQFAKFAAHYQRGAYFFDIHPPLGKLTFAYLGGVLGYDSSKCDFITGDIGEEYAPECKIFVLRAVSALFGSLLPVMVFRIVKELNCSSLACFLAACLVNFDMINATEARLVLVDSQLMLYIALATWLSLCFFNAHSHNPVTMTTWRLHLWALIIGVTCGCAISVKWTALATPAIILVEFFFGFWFLKGGPLPLTAIATSITAMLATYVFWFWVHFASLPYRSDRPLAFIPYHFSAQFQRTLIGGDANVVGSGPSFFSSFAGLNREMWLVNNEMTDPHAWSSKYYQWVLNLRGMGYWSGGKDAELDVDDSFDGVSRTIYLLGNPIVIWLTSGCALVTLVLCALRLRYGAALILSQGHLRSFLTCSYLVFGWATNLLPFAAVGRTAFIYHYLPGLLQAQICSAVLIDGFTRGWFRTAVISLVLVAVVTSYVYFSPWIYALPLTESSRQDKRWLQGWN